LKKISRVTSNTAKTVNTYAGAGKDHTSRQVPQSLSSSSSSPSYPSFPPTEAGYDADAEANAAEVTLHMPPPMPSSTEEEKEEVIDGLVASSSSIPIPTPALVAVDADDDPVITPINSNIGNNSTSTSNKKWTDTDILHHGLESNQLPGYTRALSYQVRMREIQ